LQQDAQRRPTKFPTLIVTPQQSAACIPSGEWTALLNRYLAIYSLEDEFGYPKSATTVGSLQNYDLVSKGDNLDLQSKTSMEGPLQGEEHREEERNEGCGSLQSAALELQPFQQERSFWYGLTKQWEVYLVRPDC